MSNLKESKNIGVFNLVKIDLTAKFIAIIICTTIFFISADSVLAKNGANDSLHVIVNGHERNYFVHYPDPELKMNGQYPVIIALHGGLGNAERMEKSSNLNTLADREKFIVVYPEGTNVKMLKKAHTWNAGVCCGAAVKKNIDDVEFLSRMIDDLVKNYHGDPKRIYVTGMSNGAMMAYRLACERPEKIAAIVPVAGTLAIPQCSTTATEIPVLHIHGEQDTNVPIHGGKGKRSVAGIEHRSVYETMDLLARNRECQKPVVSEDKPDLELTVYQCSRGADIQLLRLKRAGHVWPEPSIEGINISAAELIWEFSRKFSKP